MEREMLHTSYFSKYRGDRGISIARSHPKGFKGEEYPALAPSKWFFEKYKMDSDFDFFSDQYKKEVLSLLDPSEVFMDLGPDGVLLCWEGEGKPCHRHLVSAWLNEHLSIGVTEL